MCKKMFYGYALLLLLNGGFVLADDAEITGNCKTLEKEKEVVNRECESPEDKACCADPSDASPCCCPNALLNIHAAHERVGESALGKKNSSAIAFAPLISCGDFTLESDLYYGRQFTYDSFLTSEKNISKIGGDGIALHDNFETRVCGYAKNAMDGRTNKAHFYRPYSRLTYVNKPHDFKVVIGDTASRNVVGYQRGVSGIGISIFRQGGNGSVVNSGSGIVITRLSKVECNLGDEELSSKILVPGVYSLDDFPEEAKLPGVRLKITDQINRKEVLEADYFAGYGTLNEGKDDFDVIAVCESKYDFEDPHRIKYRKKPRFVGNYRRGYSDAITWGAGIEAYEKSVILDSVAIFVTEFGTFAPNLSYSYAKWGDDKKSHSAGAGFYYKLPENPYGIFFETFLGLKAKGFSDLGKGEDDAETYNKFIERYFTDAGLKDKFKCTSSESSSSRQIIARVYTKPLFGCITPAFIFGGLWSKNQRFREYTLSLVCRIFDYCSMVVSGGLSYDDPFRGVNQKAPDRRLTVACTIPIGTDFSLAGTYYHHEDDRLRSSASIAYTPVALEGLEIKAERSWLPGFNNNSAYVKYDGSYFNIKVEEKIENQFEHDGKSASHRNRQRVFFGSSLTTDGIKSARKVNINVLRTAEESMK